nr:hypothetical protein [Tanacetum cinerariifolium]
MQKIEEKVYMSKALDASLVDTESSGTKSKEQDTCIRSGNDAHANDADVKPIYVEELITEEKGFAIASLKNELRKLTRNSVKTKFAKSSILGKPVLQPHRNQSVVRQPPVFKSKRPRISKPWFASQVVMNNDLPKPITTHYFPRERQSAFVKLHHMIAPSSSRYSSNDMVHNHYLEEAKKKIQESGRNSRPSMMPSARSQSTANVNSRAKVPSNKKTNRNKLVEKDIESSTTKVDSEPLHGSNTNITNLQECIQTLDLSASTSINVQEEQNLGLSACTPFNLKKDRIKTWTKDNVISGRPRLHGIASLQEISARPSSQGIRSLLTS